MPTQLDRIQCLCEPQLYADVLTLAKLNNKTKSAMAGELLKAALKLTKYRDQLEEAAVRFPPKEDPRHRERQPQFIANNEKVQAAIAGVDLSDPKMQKLFKMLAEIADTMD